jgi:hypothetical protein
MAETSYESLHSFISEASTKSITVSERLYLKQLFGFWRQYTDYSKAARKIKTH